MKITINAKTLTHALKMIKPVTTAGTKFTTMLGGVHLRADGETVTVTATDFERVVRLTLPATVEAPGECLILAKLLADCLATEKGDATLEAKGVRLTVTAQGATAEFPTFYAPDFPVEALDALAAADAATLALLDARALLHALDRVSFAASEDVTRINLCGVHFEAIPATGDLLFVATDGHRLARVETNLSARDLALGAKGETVSSPGLDVLARLAKGTKAANVRIGVHKCYFVAKCENATLVVKTITSTFPNWRQVVPKVSTVKVTAKRDALIAAIKPGKKADTMIFETGEALAISYRDSDMNETKRQAAATCDGEVRVAFNPAYLVEALQSFTSDEVVIKLSDGLAPAIITAANDDSQIHVIMPMRA